MCSWLWGSASGISMLLQTVDAVDPPPPSSWLVQSCIIMISGLACRLTIYEAGEVGGGSGKFVTVESIRIRGLRCSRYCGSKSSRLQGSDGQAAFSLLWLYLLLGVSLDPAKNPKDLEAL